VLQIGEVPDPKPREGDLIVRVRAAGVNRADLLQRLGRYPPPAGEPGIIGLEIAGEVEHATGPYQRGDRVMALLAGGATRRRLARRLPRRCGFRRTSPSRKPPPFPRRSSLLAQI